MVPILRNCDPLADCKPIVLMSCFLLIFWLLLSYVTNSYFAIFLMVSNFILIFGCCVSLSGYVVGQLINTRRDTGLIEVTTVSSTQPFVRPAEYPPTYEEAIRYGWQHCRTQPGGDGVVLCIPLENEPRPIYMNVVNGTSMDNSFVPIGFNGTSNFPSSELTTTNARSPLPLTWLSRSSTVSDLSSHLETATSTVLETNPSESAESHNISEINETVPKIAPLYKLRSSTENDTSLELEASKTTNIELGLMAKSPGSIETYYISESNKRSTKKTPLSRLNPSTENTKATTITSEASSMDSAPGANGIHSISHESGTIQKGFPPPKDKSRIPHERDWQTYDDLSILAEILEESQNSYRTQCPRSHKSLNRSLSFPGNR